jgi:hypothetical protein
MKTRINLSGKYRGFISASILSLLIVFLTATNRAEAQFINFGSPAIQSLGPRYQVNGYGPAVPFFFLNGPGTVQDGSVYSNDPYIPPVILDDNNTNGVNVTPTEQTTGNAIVDGNNVTINARGSLSGKFAMPRTSDSIDAMIDKDDRLVVRWSGDPRSVRRVTVALLDKDRKVLKQETIARLPVQARIGLTAKTSYYQVLIEYVNGTMTSMVSPL